MIAVEVLGRKAQHFLAKSKVLSSRIYGVLENNLEEERKSNIAKEWVRLKSWDIAYGITILKSFQKGITNQ